MPFEGMALDLFVPAGASCSPCPVIPEKGSFVYGARLIVHRGQLSEGVSAVVCSGVGRRGLQPNRRYANA
jgi:hypothetical protein